MATNAKNIAELLNTDTTVAVGDIADGSVTTVKLAADAVTNAKIADEAIQTENIKDEYTEIQGGSFDRNLLMNGDMSINQRKSGATGSYADPTDGNFGLDRWKMWNNNDGAATFSQETTVPSGTRFEYSQKIEVTTADTSIAAGQYLALAQYVEGLRHKRMGFGASGAKTSYISFWVRSSLTGTYCYSIRNNTPNRSFVKEFTIDTADTWEKKTFSIAGDTGGTWQTTRATTGAIHQISLTMGSTFQGTADSWQGSNVVGTSNQVNLMASTHDFYITGWQVEDTEHTPFQFLSYHDNLRNCQRFYLKSYPFDNEPGVAANAARGQTRVHSDQASTGRYPWSEKWPVEMASNPTVTLYPGRTGVSATAGNVTAYNGNNSAAATNYTPALRVGVSTYIGAPSSYNQLTFNYVCDSEL